MSFSDGLFNEDYDRKCGIVSMSGKPSAASDNQIQLGQLYETNIHGIGHDGEGVGRIGGITVFIRGGVPGDRLKVRPIEVKKSFARAELVECLWPSPDRIDPPCPVAHRCGGCQVQHIDYSTQLKLKSERVINALKRIGRLEDIPVLPTIGMENPWHYRNKAQFPVGYAAGKLVAGFFASGSHNIVDIQSCPIQHELTNEILSVCRELIQQYDVSIYDRGAKRGLLRHIIPRVGVGSDEAMVIFVTRDKEFNAGKSIAKAIMERIPKVVSVIQNINPSRTNVVMGNRNLVLGGKDHIIDESLDLKLTVSPDSFLQVNPEQTVKLYEQVIQYADLQGHETVLDLYAGIGSLSLKLAKSAREVIGIEWVRAAVKDAENNAVNNDIHNARFIAGDVAQVVPQLVEEGIRPDVVVVDPPRKGCDEKVLTTIGRTDLTRIVYVSCHPESMARDLKRLSEFGFNASAVQPVDMFPHTAHVECVTQLSR